MPKIKYNANTPLYSLAAKAWAIEELPALLEQVSASGKPLVIYLHGRGMEPSKSLQGATWTKGLAAFKLALGYECEVIMFNWDSRFPFGDLYNRALPLSKVPEGAASFMAFTDALEKALPHSALKTLPTLVAHSMGSIVLAQATLDGAFSKGMPFSRILITGADADNKGHERWLAMLAEKVPTYVTWNQDDKVLKKSTKERANGSHALGLGTDTALVEKAIYVDLTGMGKNGEKDDDHEVFGKGAMNGQIHLCHFFSQVIRGEPVKLTLNVNVESIQRKCVYKLISATSHGAPCLKIPALPKNANATNNNDLMAP